MARILLVYGTTEGQTEKIAKRIASLAQADGHHVDCRLGADGPSDLKLEDCDAVIIGASVRYYRFQKYIRDFAAKNREVLRLKPTAFFSVSGAASSPEGELEARSLTERFLKAVHWQPNKIGIFAGAVLYTKYNFIIRWMMKRIVKRAGGPTDTSQDYEFTDWDAVAQFTKEFVRELPTAATERLVGEHSPRG